MESNISKCPYCHEEMVLKKAPYKYDGSYVGVFEAYVCNFCHRIYFTEDSLKEILELPISLSDFESWQE